MAHRAARSYPLATTRGTGFWSVKGLGVPPPDNDRLILRE